MLLMLNHLEQCSRCLCLITLSSPSNTPSLCIPSTVRLVLNTTPLLWDFDPLKLLLLFMSNHHIRKSVSFTVHHYHLASDLAQAAKTMWLCKKCVSQSLFCHVSSEFSKCSECTAHTFWKCDLVIFKAEWAQI